MCVLVLVLFFCPYFKITHFYKVKVIFDCNTSVHNFVVVVLKLLSTKRIWTQIKRVLILRTSLIKSRSCRSGNYKLIEIRTSTYLEIVFERWWSSNE